MRKLPPAPKQLSREAKSWWRTFVEGWDMDDSALLILEGALESFDRMRQAQELIASEGVTCKDRFGQVKQHPATCVERDAKATMLRHLKALNLDLEPIHNGVGRPPAKW
jgi:P27 family predicted phage terminase small subunit